jgi:hypothetical protein
MRTRKFLSRSAASRHIWRVWGISIAPSTLAKYAVIGCGPVFHRVGRSAQYDPADLDSWIASRIGPRIRSTSTNRKRMTPSPSRARHVGTSHRENGTTPTAIGTRQVGKQ